MSVEEDKTDVKIIHLPIELLSKSKNQNRDLVTSTSQNIPRKITNSSRWTFTEEDLNPWNQLSHLNLSNSKPSKLFQALVRQKIGSYRYQDIGKGMYNAQQFIDFPYTIQLFREFMGKSPTHLQTDISGVLCYYCRQPVRLLYASSRDPQQWTIERIDNSIGHNKGNVAIACLQCNLKRRTIHHERYLSSKHIQVHFHRLDDQE